MIGGPSTIPTAFFNFQFDNTYELAKRGMGWLLKGKGEVYETDGSRNPYAKLCLIDKNGLRQAHPSPGLAGDEADRCSRCSFHHAIEEE